MELQVTRKASAKALIPGTCGGFAERKGQCGWDHREKGIGADFKVQETIRWQIRYQFFRTSKLFGFYSRCIWTRKLRLQEVKRLVNFTWFYSCRDENPV